MNDAGDQVRCEVDDRGVATITLDRPQVHNAFDDALVGELAGVLASLVEDEAARVIVLTGEGRSFSAGADLEHMRSMAGADREANVADAMRLAELMYLLDTHPKPTVARVQGAAFGGAVGLIACCDVAVAGASARFALSEVRLGLAPAVISPYVVRAMGSRQARRWFVTGERMDARTAERIGLVHEAVADEALDDRVGELVEAILQGGPRAISTCKHLARALGGDQTPDLRRSTAELISELRVGDEGQEGLSAFLEKREPSWRDSD